MTDDLLDLFGSFSGRIGRREWWIGATSVAVAAILGIWLFNTDDFDESRNAIAEAPTMAAFLWAALCLFMFTAVSAKRLDDRGRPRWLAYAIAVIGAILIGGWGLALFTNPFVASANALLFWALIAALFPVLLECAAAPGFERRS